MVSLGCMNGAEPMKERSGAMQTNRRMWGVVLMVTVVAWLGWGTPLALAQRARVPQTGQTTSYAPGDDGAIQAGVELPTPRFMDRHDGTVRDNLTGLIWLKQTNCLVGMMWAQALTAATTLASGSCGLTDHSQAGDWRLPNVNELHSLINRGFFYPALSNAAGTAPWTEGDAFSGNLVAYAFWSSTTSLRGDYAWSLEPATGRIDEVAKDAHFSVWPVRGGD
jgi:Protein of unknown function (DUF1566)